MVRLATSIFFPTPFILSLCKKGTTGLQVMLLPFYFKYKHPEKYAWRRARGACTLCYVSA